MKKSKKILNTIYKILLGITICIIILVVTAFTTSYFYLNNKLGKINYVGITKDDVEVNANVEKELAEYRNIVLLGIDAREDTFSGSRSDCIIIVSINNNTKDVKLTSVYRDTYLNIDGFGLDKVTHAYAYGGPTLSMSTLNKNLDLNISEFVTVNFDTVKAVVDSIGGVEIYVSDEEASQISGISSEGTYNLDGSQALAYSRIRKIDTDYRRSERMRTVLNEVFEKAKTKNVTELNSLANTLLPHVYTNISKSEIVSLLSEIFYYNVTDSVGWPYNTKGITLDRWYGVPITLEENVRQLHKNVFEEPNYEPSDTVKDISNRIVNKTGYTYD